MTEMRAWGWRIPFVIGAAAAVVALFLRRALHETQSAEGRAGRRRARCAPCCGTIRSPCCWCSA